MKKVSTIIIIEIPTNTHDLQKIVFEKLPEVDKIFSGSGIEIGIKMETVVEEECVKAWDREDISSISLGDSDIEDKILNALCEDNNILYVGNLRDYLSDDKNKNTNSSIASAKLLSSYFEKMKEVLQRYDDEKGEQLKRYGYWI